MSSFAPSTPWKAAGSYVLFSCELAVRAQPVFWIVLAYVSLSWDLRVLDGTTPVAFEHVTTWHLDVYIVTCLIPPYGPQPSGRQLWWETQPRTVWLRFMTQQMPFARTDAAPCLARVLDRQPKLERLYIVAARNHNSACSIVCSDEAGRWCSAYARVLRSMLAPLAKDALDSGDAELWPRLPPVTLVISSPAPGEISAITLQEQVEVAFGGFVARRQIRFEVRSYPIQRLWRQSRSPRLRALCHLRCSWLEI